MCTRFDKLEALRKAAWESISKRREFEWRVSIAFCGLLAAFVAGFGTRQSALSFSCLDRWLLAFLLFSSELGTFCGCLAFGEPTKSIRERKRHSGKKCDRKPHSTNLKKSRIFEKRPENRRGILQPNSSRPAPLYFLQSLLFFAFDSVKNHLLCPNRAEEVPGWGTPFRN